ncbi:glucoamylase family protein [Methylotetracoccus oryzae]|uniref:glucoamylase family protein n=1 Tax=Methylotetracoccus oryzae TaxID=1919059 RepID=UPI00111A696B|nr:glucoamylase family protein [Methylotetracoccus oryzae]
MVRPLILILLSLAAAQWPADPVSAAEQAPVKQLVLADFEQPGGRPIAVDWQRDPPESEFGFRYELTASDRGGQALRLTYRLPDEPSKGSAPEQEYSLGQNLMGLDLSAYDQLSFWIKGDDGEGFSPRLTVKFRRAAPKTAGAWEEASYAIPNVGPDWQQIVIPLKKLKGLKEWRPMAYLLFGLDERKTPVRHGAYLVDDLQLVQLGTPGENLAGGGDATPPAAPAEPPLQWRLNGWPEHSVIDASDLPADDIEFLRRVASDTWRGLDALADREHGLPLDRIQYAKTQADQPGIGDYTSTTNIGFRLLAVIAAYELKLIDEAQAVQRLETTLNTLAKLDTAHGFFYNYYNTTRLQPTSSFLSFVDSSWLTAGLMVTRQTFPSLAERCNRIIDQGDYRFFYDEAAKLMTLGYSVDTGQRSSDHYGTLFAESRIGSLIAIGRGTVPREHWFAMMRTFPPDAGWQTQVPLDRKEKVDHGFTWTGGVYEWKGLRYVPSWGGSLFEALMPTLVLDEKQHAAESLGRNGAIHTEIQRRYALEELGYPVWGMSPSSTPGSNGYGEYGVRVLGSHGYPEGAVSPHAAALALLTEPEAATRNLRRLAERYAIYGDFGFYDAVIPGTGEVAYVHLCLNQAMILIAIADHLADHAIQKRFAADPIIQPVLDLIGFENFFN